jgi:hypothetical protein
MERLAGPALQAILEAIEGVENAACRKTIEDDHADWLLRHGMKPRTRIVTTILRS